MLLTSQSLASLPMQTQASTSTVPPNSFKPHCGQPLASLPASWPGLSVEGDVRRPTKGLGHVARGTHRGTAVPGSFPFSQTLMVASVRGKGVPGQPLSGPAPGVHAHTHTHTAQQLPHRLLGQEEW